jgi:hypothetical protein
MLNPIADIIYLNVNGLVDIINSSFTFNGLNGQVTLLYEPIVGSNVSVTYIYYR